MPTSLGFEIGDLVTLNPEHHEYEFCRRVLNGPHPGVTIFRIIEIEMGKYIRTTPSECGFCDQNRWMKVSTKKKKKGFAKFMETQRL